MGHGGDHGERTTQEVYRMTTVSPHTPLLLKLSLIPIVNYPKVSLDIGTKTLIDS